MPSLSLFKHAYRIYPKTINYFYDRNLFYAGKIIFCWVFHAETFFEFILSSREFIIAKILATNTFRKLLKLCKIIAKAMRMHKPLDSGSPSLKLVTVSEIKSSGNTSSQQKRLQLVVTAARNNFCYEGKIWCVTVKLWDVSFFK
jgi:hypothetical protein